jgi:hypothetical protein
MALAYIPITLTNNESTATAASFQQLIQNIDMRAYDVFLNSDLSNVFFTSDSAGSTVINSWIESGNTALSTDTTVWVVTSIAANSSVTVYMQVDLAGTNHLNTTTTGVAPQLTATYAQYDNGANVFAWYNNFVSSTGWVANSGITATFSSTSGLSITLGGTPSSYGWSGIIYGTSFYSSVPFIQESYQELTSSTGNLGAGGSNYATPSGTTDQFNPDFEESESGNAQPNWYYGGATSFHTAAGINTNQFYIFQLQNTASAQIASILTPAYSSVETATASAEILSPYYPTIGSGGNTGTGIAYWIRIRAYPPNGVMPSVSIGQPTNFPYIKTSTDAVEVLP